MSERINREEELFDAARQLREAEEIAAFLASACEGDPDLRARVEGLLSARTEAEEFFRPLSPAPPIPRPPAANEEVGTDIGRYTLRERIGEGGMGVVHRAEQHEPVRRQVALKIIKLGMDTREVVARFEAERQALALMDHPNIAKVLDAGATGMGRPFFAMELVEGVPITEYCGQKRLSLEQRLRLFIPVCQAVQHAHQKGIIHRDLKPSNVLVTDCDGVPTPKVIDFGVAKALHQRLTDKTLFTQHATMIGTPAYMSPEQAEMSGLDVDTRSDIYSLGVLLYELLTGSQPFPEQRLRKVGYSEIQRIILREDPERPSTRLRNAAPTGTPPSTAISHSHLATDLDWIVMKCLEKDRNRRYETANGLAADLQRFLADEPIAARPPTTAYRLQKIVRRHRAASLATALIAFAVLVGSVVSGWALIRERTARRAANERLEAALAFVGQVLTNVAPGIRNLTGAAEVQQNLGKATADFARNLGAQAMHDPSVRTTLARALVALSSAQNPGGANSVGLYQDGLAMAKEAVGLLTEPIPNLPESERLNQLYSARFAVIQCLIGLGRWDEARALSAELEPLISQLESYPQYTRLFRRERCSIRGNAGYALILAGRARESVSVMQELLNSDWIRSLSDTADDLELESLANSHDNLVLAHGILREYPEMLTHALAGGSVCSNLVRRTPSNAKFRQMMVELESKRGWALIGLGRTNEGLALLESNRREVERLLGQDPANDPFRNAHACIASTQAAAFAVWSEEASATDNERLDRCQTAERYLREADSLSRASNFQEAAARVALARTGVEAARRKLEGAGGPPVPR